MGMHPGVQWQEIFYCNAQAKSPNTVLKKCIKLCFLVLSLQVDVLPKIPKLLCQMFSIWNSKSCQNQATSICRKQWYLSFNVFNCVWLYPTSPVAPTLKTCAYQQRIVQGQVLISKMQGYENISVAKCFHLAPEPLSCWIPLMTFSLLLSHHLCKHTQGHPETEEQYQCSHVHTIITDFLHTKPTKYPGCTCNWRTHHILWFQMKLYVFRNQQASMFCLPCDRIPSQKSLLWRKTK